MRTLLPWIFSCLAVVQAPPSPLPEVSDAYVQEQVAVGRQYTIAVLTSGSAAMPPAAELAGLQAAHLRHLFTLKRKGEVLLAGPLAGHPHIRGIVIFATGDVETARRLVAGDPLVSRGLMNADVQPFFGIPGDALR